MEPALRRLLDLREIEDVLVDYCRHLDRMDLPALAALFTENGRAVYGPDPRLAAEGRAAIEASLARMWRWRRTAHHLANVRVLALSDDEARAESDVLAWHESPGGESATAWGLYLDRLRRTPEGWRIAERRMELKGADGGFRVPVPPAERRPPPPGWRPPEGLDGLAR